MDLKIPHPKRLKPRTRPTGNPFERSLNKGSVKEAFISRLYAMTDSFFLGDSVQDLVAVPIHENCPLTDHNTVEWELGQGYSSLFLNDLFSFANKLTPRFIRDLIKRSYDQLVLFFSMDELEMDETVGVIMIQSSGPANLARVLEHAFDETEPSMAEKKPRLIQFVDAMWDIIYRSLMPLPELLITSSDNPFHIILPKKVSGIFTRYLIRGPSRIKFSTIFY